MFFITNKNKINKVFGDVSLPLYTEALDHAVGLIDLRRQSSRVWGEGGLNAL